MKIPRFDPVRYASINTPSLFGAGWIERISSKTIVYEQRRRALSLMANELNLDFDGVPAGRVRRLPGRRVGKFGWKAPFATLAELVAVIDAWLNLPEPVKAGIVAMVRAALATR